jgi:hypothetical protein
VDELSFRCGQMSVRREAANVLPIIAGIRDSAVQLDESIRVGRDELTPPFRHARPVQFRGTVLCWMRL